MNTRTINLEKLEWVRSIKPDKDGRQYYIYNTDFGRMNKHDADIISKFLRDNFWQIISKSFEF